MFGIFVICVFSQYIVIILTLLILMTDSGQIDNRICISHTEWVNSVYFCRFLLFLLTNFNVVLYVCVL